MGFHTWSESNSGHLKIETRLTKLNYTNKGREAEREKKKKLKEKENKSNANERKNEIDWMIMSTKTCF